MKLVIVESPTKARTIGRFLGSDYTIKAEIKAAESKAFSTLFNPVVHIIWLRDSILVDKLISSMYICLCDMRGIEYSSGSRQNWLARNRTKITYPAGGAIIAGLVTEFVGAPASILFASQSEPALEKSLLKLAEIEMIGGGGLIILGGLTFAITHIIESRMKTKMRAK